MAKYHGKYDHQSAVLLGQIKGDKPSGPKRKSAFAIISAKAIHPMNAAIKRSGSKIISEVFEDFEILGKVPLEDVNVDGDTLFSVLIPVSYHGEVASSAELCEELWGDKGIISYFMDKSFFLENVVKAVDLRDYAEDDQEAASRPHLAFIIDPRVYLPEEDAERLIRKFGKENRLIEEEDGSDGQVKEPEKEGEQESGQDSNAEVKKTVQPGTEAEKQKVKSKKK